VDDHDDGAAVTLADDVAAALPGLRAEAEALMVDTVQVRRPTGTAADDDGNVVTTYAATDVYAGPAKVQDPGLTAMSEESGSATATRAAYEVHVPVSAGPFLPGDVVFMAGVARFRVLMPHVKSWQTAQRLPVEVVS
jgi:hypothetical protein